MYGWSLKAFVQRYFFSINTTEIVLKAKLLSLGGEGVSGRSWGGGLSLST